MHEDIARVLRFWFGPGEPAFQQRWFDQDEAFDAEVRTALAADHWRAAAGHLWDWAAVPRGSLALVLLLDQVPRNLYRGTARAFATDGAALTVARRAVRLGHDKELHPVERLFLYLPFEHGEALADQLAAVRLFHALGDANAYDYAVRHWEIIRRFGRFPHRNAALGRPTTLREAAFLRQPGSSF